MILRCPLLTSFLTQLIRSQQFVAPGKWSPTFDPCQLSLDPNKSDSRSAESRQHSLGGCGRPQRAANGGEVPSSTLMGEQGWS